MSGQNVVIEYRAADGKIERFLELATELARLKVDLILASNTPAARAAQQATTTIPIVATAMGDPCRRRARGQPRAAGREHHRVDFPRPGVGPKHLELLRQALPKVSRVAALWHPGVYGEGTMREMIKATEDAARTLRVRLQLVGVRGPDEIDRAFSTMVRERAEALIVFPSPMLFAERRRIVDLTTRHRLPSMFNTKEYKEYVELGGLIAYGASATDLARRGAIYVDKILKGTRPADLPVEQPTKFELLINLKTAKALGLTIPPSVLRQADRVVE